jgi:hypothetical protein
MYFLGDLCGFLAVAFLLLDAVRLVGGATLILRPTLRTPLDAIQLMAPVPLKFLCPIMHTFQLLGLELVQTLLALFSDCYETDLAEHTQVL